jgi:transcriptional regulator with XRE-family HTH domain
MPAGLNATVAARIREIRTKKGWSQEELAARCELHRTYIGAIERNETNLTLRTLETVANALDCSIADLLSPARRSGGK